MWSFIIITVLSALAACYGSAVFQSEEKSGGYTLVFDEMSPNGRILTGEELNSRADEWVVVSQGIIDAPAVSGRVQRMGTVYEGDLGVVIDRLTISLITTPSTYKVTPFGSNVMEVLITSHLGDPIHSTVTSYRKA